jgi:hypothetical protein
MNKKGLSETATALILAVLIGIAFLFIYQFVVGLVNSKEIRAYETICYYGEDCKNMTVDILDLTKEDCDEVYCYNLIQVGELRNDEQWLYDNCNYSRDFVEEGEKTKVFSVYKCKNYTVEIQNG